MLKYFIISLLFLTNIIFSNCIYVRICNRGGYLAKCYIESQVVNYEIQIYRYNTGLFPVLQCSKMDIPFDASWTRLECKALTFIAIYSTIFTEEFTSELLNTCYVITGTTLNPSWSQIRC